jgi:REP element-mobilizing transposase RayT
MNKNTRRYIKRPRLPGYDYSSPSAYMVTIDTNQRLPLFKNAELRAVLKEVWRGLPDRFPAVKLDMLVILADHLHTILWLDAEAETRPLLGEVIRVFKAKVSVKWTQQTGRATRIWQRNYHDRIVRDERHLQRVRQYVYNNPLKHTLKNRGFE